MSIPMISSISIAPYEKTKHAEALRSRVGKNAWETLESNFSTSSPASWILESDGHPVAAFGVIRMPTIEGAKVGYVWLTPTEDALPIFRKHLREIPAELKKLFYRETKQPYDVLVSWMRPTMRNFRFAKALGFKSDEALDCGQFQEPRIPISLWWTECQVIPRTTQSPK